MKHPQYYAGIHGCPDIDYLERALEHGPDQRRWVRRFWETGRPSPGWRRREETTFWHLIPRCLDVALIAARRARERAVAA